MKKVIIVGIFVILVIAAVLGGYYAFSTPEEEVTSSTESTALKPVNSETVKKFQNTRITERKDIYTPIIEQWEGSAHAKAADSPETTGHDAPYCYPCHSADYFFYTGEERPVHTDMKNGITCISCHKMDVASFILSDNDRVKLCTHCHTASEGEPLKPGDEAHHAQREVYNGEGAVGIAKMANPKVQKGLACSDCHMPNQNHDFKALTPEEAAKENRSSICFMCHKEEDREKFSKKIAALQKDVGTRKDKLLKDLEGIRAELDKMKEANQDVSSLEKEYGTAFTNVTIVDTDKSRGVHHPEYVKKLLEDSERRVAEIKKKL